MQIPIEVFDIFFGTFLKQESRITQQEFSDLISEAENRLFAIGDATVPEVENQQPKAAIKLGGRQEAPETEREVEMP